MEAFTGKDADFITVSRSRKGARRWYVTRLTWRNQKWNASRVSRMFDEHGACREEAERVAASKGLTVQGWWKEGAWSPSI